MTLKGKMQRNTKTINRFIRVRPFDLRALARGVTQFWLPLKHRKRAPIKRYTPETDENSFNFALVSRLVKRSKTELPQAKSEYDLIDFRFCRFKYNAVAMLRSKKFSEKVGKEVA